MVIDNLSTDDVRFFCFVLLIGGFMCIFFFFFDGLFSFWVLCDFQMSLNPWLGCEEHAECARA